MTTATTDPFQVAADIIDPQIDPADADPVYFVEEVIGAETWSKQRDILRSVAEHERTAVRSCHGIGKTWTAACAALWFLKAHKDSRVITTAPVWRQVEKLLWHEIRQIHRKSNEALGGRLLTTELRYDDGRYAIGLSTDPNELESFQGHHAPHLLLIYDEASGIPQAIYDAGEGYMTTEGAKQLLIGNPTQPQGEFYGAFHTDRALYNRIHVSAFDLPWATGEEVSDELARRLTSKAWAEGRIKKWGKDSPLAQVKVFGNFPKEADNTVISLAAIEAAQAAEIVPDPDEPKVLGCDVARFGSDETTIYLRHGNHIDFIEAYNGKRTTHTAGRLTALHKQHGARVVVDDAGVGGGVTDILVENDVPVTPFNGGETAIDPTAYPNARSELWCTVGDEVAELDLPDVDDLAADLAAPQYKLDSKGRRQVEKKEETKKRLGRSPDHGDGMLLTMAPERQSTTEVW